MGAASTRPSRLRPLPTPADTGSHSGISTTVGRRGCWGPQESPLPPSTPRAPPALTRPLLWPPARPPGPDPRPAPLCSHHPSAPQGPQLPSPGTQSLQTHPGGVPVSSPPVQSGCSQGPSESKQTLWSASAAPGRPPACPRERRRYGLHSHVTLVGGEALFPSTWWGGGRGSLTRQHLRLSRQGFGGAGVNRRLWERG